MQLITRSSRTLFFVLFLFGGTTWAALPDPITFSWAIERDDIQKVTAWLDEGLDPEFQTNQLGSGLMIAAWYGNIPMMSLFVERGANVRRANRNGEQPLQLAAWNGHLEAVKWLLAHGAVLNREGNHWGALHYAVFNGHQELAKYLIEQGAEVNARSPNKSTPLILAAREGREDMTKVLLESGADPRSRNDWGDTALTLAMRYDHYRLGKMISTPEEFSIAVKAPKESFGEASRSGSAPTEIEMLLAQIREAEAEGRPSEALHKQLLEAVNAFRRNAMARKAAARQQMPRPYEPSRTLVITGKRGRPGVERAQVIVDGQPVNTMGAAKPVNGAGSITITPVNKRVTQAQIAELMRQIRLEEAQGGTANDLKNRLYEAVESLKQ